jgi:hypothetical protein
MPQRGSRQHYNLGVQRHQPEGCGCNGQFHEDRLKALKSVNNFGTDKRYRDGMAQQQIDSIINFLMNVC